MAGLPMTTGADPSCSGPKLPSGHALPSDATVGATPKVLSVLLAYNLGNLWRRLVPPSAFDMWSLTSLQQRLVKTGGRLVKHARYYWLLLAESHLPRCLFGAMLQRIWALPAPTG